MCVLNLFINFFLFGHRRKERKNKYRDHSSLLRPASSSSFFSVLFRCNQICKHRLFSLFFLFLQLIVCSPCFTARICAHGTDSERAHTYTLVQPRVNRGTQTSVDQIIAFFIGYQPRRNAYSLVVHSFSREEGERAERKKNTCERPRVHIQFIFFFADRHTHLHKSFSTHEHVTNLHDQTETVHLSTKVQTEVI